MRFLRTTCAWLEFLGLGIWIGGMLTIGALVAPTVFNHIESMEIAGGTMSLIFRKFNGGLVYVCIFLSVIGFSGKVFLSPRPGWPRRIEGGLLAAMIVFSIYIGSVLGPELQDLREIRVASPDNLVVKEEFEQKHGVSEGLFSMNLVFGLVVLFLAARETVPPKGPELKEGQSG